MLHINLFKTKRLLLFFALSFAAVCEANAADPELLAVQAAGAYNRKDYVHAAKLYEQIIAQGYESAPLYYNLGNAYFRNNELAPAVLFYEKALKIDPNNDDIRHNIEIVNRKLVDKVEFVPELFYKRWWKQLLNIMSVKSLAIVSFVLLILALAFGALYVASSSLALRKTGFWTGLAFALLFALSLAAGLQRKHYMTRHHEAIVFTPTVNVKSSPDENSKDIFVLHEGTKVVLLDVVDTWQEIRISNGSIGWLPLSDLKNI